MPAIIVENLLWSTLFLVGLGVLNVLIWIVFSSYLVSDIFLFPVLVWKVVEGVFSSIAVILYSNIKLVHKAKTTYYCNKIKESLSCKQLFSVANQLLGNKKPSPLLCFRVAG